VSREKKIVFVGGISCVGKTTVIDSVLTNYKFAKKGRFADFILEVIKRDNIKVDMIPKMNDYLENEAAKLCGRFVQNNDLTFLDFHYAIQPSLDTLLALNIHTDEKFQEPYKPSLKEINLLKIIGDASPTLIYLYAPDEQILNRRISESNYRKIRNPTLEGIIEERTYEQLYFNRYVNFLKSKIKSVASYEIENRDGELKRTVELIIKYLGFK
jgi:adenylate kinase